MTRAVPEWRGRTDDTAIPPRVKADVALAFNGRCAECTRKLEPGKWQCDHVIALINGGQHRQTNLQPLCTKPCHEKKTKQDVAIKSKSARIRQKHLGIKRSSRPMAGSKASGWKKPFNRPAERRA